MTIPAMSADGTLMCPRCGSKSLCRWMVVTMFGDDDGAQVADVMPGQIRSWRADSTDLASRSKGVEIDFSCECSPESEFGGVVDLTLHIEEGEHATEHRLFWEIRKEERQ